jgi:thiamine biosynthesis lipoprotein
MAEPFTRCRPELGTFVEISGECEEAVEAGFAAISKVHGLMSAHLPESDVSRLNRFGHLNAVEVDSWTVAVIERSLFWSRQSGGAFDIVTAGAAAIETGYLPRHPGQPKAQGTSWRCVAAHDTAVSLRIAACIDLGGIAKGFAVDCAVEAMKAAGATSGLVNAGGDIACFGPQPWTIAVADPSTRQPIANVAVANGAIATSSIQPDGSDTHLPRRSAELRSATVCAPNAMDADALTKIVLSGSPLTAECLEIAHARAFVVGADGAISNVERHRRAA